MEEGRVGRLTEKRPRLEEGASRCFSKVREPIHSPH